jgi:ABC-type transport system involved in cytochrome c biogenesis permease subunit
LPVLDGGRYKPLDSLAWETLRMISNRASFTEPETGHHLDATALYLSMLLDWQAGPPATDGVGAANPHGGTSPHGEMSPHSRMSPHGGMILNSRATYFRNRQPDRWDRMPLILVDSLELADALGIARGQKYMSAYDLSRVEIEDQQSHAKTRFSVYAQRLSCRQGVGVTAFEKKVVEVANRLWAYEDHRMGRRLQVVPLAPGGEGQWASIADLTRSTPDAHADPDGRLRRVREQFEQVHAAYRAGDPTAFAEASASFITTVRRSASELGTYPRQSIIDLEVAYNHWVPFRFAWVLTLIACLCVLASLASGWKAFYTASLVSFAAGLAAMLVGFGMRVVISGRAPVTNMYESVVYVGLGVAILGLIFELISRQRFILAAAAVVSTIALVLADNCPAILDPDLQPLNPILRNNFWLVVHVMSITLSYAAFALALGIGDISLGYNLFGSGNPAPIEALSKAAYRTILAGVVLLAVGTVTGGIWADYAWGRFWGWDPKEVWALITLLGYLAVLHARYLGWVGDRGLAALSVLCFSLVVVAWYGVNFVMGSGLHSYGFGGNGSHTPVAAALVLQFLYVALAVLRTTRLSGFREPLSGKLGDGHPVDPNSR